VRRAADDAQRARRAMRGGLVFGARIVCDAMRCARAGCIRAVRCAAHGMRCADRCAASWLRCNALRCAARCADCLRCNTLRAGRLHSRGAGGAMLFSYAIEGFLGWGFFGIGSTSIRSTVIAKLTGQTEGVKVGCGGMGVWVVITF
jgi:hypothetical protein